MAQLVITQLMDGARFGVFHVAIAGDGTGDLSNQVLIDPATSFDPALPATPGISIDRLWYDFTGFNARLEFDYLASDTLVWAMTGDQFAMPDFSHIGGLKDRSAGDGSGKLKLTTQGLGLGDFGTLIVKIHKD